MSHTEGEAGFMDLRLSSELWYLFAVIAHEECGETNCELAKCPFGVNLRINCPCASCTDCRTDGPSWCYEGPGLEAWDLLHCAVWQHVATTFQLSTLSCAHFAFSVPKGTERPESFNTFSRRKWLPTPVAVQAGY